MPDINWDRPVLAGDRLVFGPLGAHRFLMNDWPHIKNMDYAVADACILRALDGRVSPDEARELFVIALKSADLRKRSHHLRL